MEGISRLSEVFQTIVPRILSLAADQKRILVVTHIDADGLCSGSIAFAALTRKGANVALRCYPDLDPGRILALRDENFDYYLFTDLGSTLVKELADSFGDRFLVIDHHQVSEEDRTSPSVVNAWGVGVDGGTEACSSTMAFFFAMSLDPGNSDLSPLAVVGSVADRQDSGTGRSLTGLNRKALEAASAKGLVATSKDLLFTGRETRPAHEAIALTSAPQMPGLTGNRDAVLARLHEAGVQLKDGGAWKTVSSLSKDEKGKVTEIIASSVGAGGADVISQLVGEVYTLTTEDTFTPLRDAREFATLLNSCGRMGRSGIGCSICLGDRSTALADALNLLAEYRISISRALQALADEPARTSSAGRLVLIRGFGLIDERLLGPVISIVTSSPGHLDKVVVGLTDSGPSEAKVSSRRGDNFEGTLNLGVLMRELAESVGGTGGGHAMAAGAKVPISRTNDFSKLLTERVS